MLYIMYEIIYTYIYIYSNNNNNNNIRHIWVEFLIFKEQSKYEYDGNSGGIWLAFLKKITLKAKNKTKVSCSRILEPSKTNMEF